MSKLPDAPLLVSIPDACRRLGGGRTTLRELLATGTVEAVHIKTRRLVVAESLTKYVEDLRGAA